MTTSDGNSWRFVGGRIHALRKENCLTLKQLARGCGLSANTIGLVEHGQVAPTIETLCKIAHALGVSAGSLFEDVCKSADLCEARSNDPHVIFEPRSGASLTEHACAVAMQVAALDGLPYLRVLCATGCLVYETDRERFTLSPGDSLVFSAGASGEISAPGGRWRNPGSETGVAVMIFPTDAGQHSTPDPSLVQASIAKKP